MKRIFDKTQATLCLVMLAACVHDANAQACAAAGINPLPAGFAEVAGAVVSAWPTGYAPIQAPWNGGIQSGCVVQASAPVTVYRVSSVNTLPPSGYWWSAANPVQQYANASSWRAANAVCPSFNAALYVYACTMPQESLQASLGSTQSIVTVSGGVVSCLYPANNTTLQLNVSPATFTNCTATVIPAAWTNN